MLSFLLEEGVLTVGTISGLFTASMLNSFRINILEPCIEKIVPSSNLDKDKFGTSLGNIMTLPINTNVSTNKIIKWQTFLKDFITWVLVMLCLYLFYKTVLHKYKKK